MKLEAARRLARGCAVAPSPNLMTAFAFLLGTLPLWAAEGAVAGSRRVLGNVVIGGC